MNSIEASKTVQLKAEEQRRRELKKDYDKYGRLWDREDIEQTYLYNHKYIDVHLVSGESFVCELVEGGKFNYVVNIISKNGINKMAIIPKHSVKYIIVKD